MPSMGRDLHVNVPLTEHAVHYRPEGFIAEQFADVVKVGKQSDAFNIWSQADTFRQQSTARAPGTRAKKLVMHVTSETYYAHNYALALANPIEDIENADPGMWANDRQHQTETLLDALYLDWEIRLATKVTTGANVGSYAACGSAWGTAAADPFGDVNGMIDNIYDATGIRPNQLVFGETAFRKFIRSPKVKTEIFQGGQGTTGAPALVTPAMTAALFSVDKVIIGGGFQNTAAEGQTQTLAQIWGENVLALYKAPGKNRPSFMKQFRWVKPRLRNFDIVVHPYDTREQSEDIESGYYQDEKITGKPLCHLLVAVGSST